MEYKVFKTEIVGTYFRPDVSKDDIEKIKTAPITLRREPQNRFDKFAVQCLVDGFHVGYIPKKISSEISKLLASENSNSSVKWVGPGNFSVEITIGVENYLAIINPVKYRETLVTKLAEICETGAVSEVEAQMNFLLNSGYSSWHLIHQDEPIYSAVKADNIPVLEYLLAYGLKIQMVLPKALEVAVINDSRRSFLLLMNLATVLPKYTNVVIEAYKSNNTYMINHLRHFLSDVSIYRKAFEFAVKENDTNLFSDLIDLNPGKQLLRDFFLLAAKMRSHDILQKFCQLNFDHETVFQARCEAVRHGRLENFISMNSFELNSEELSVLFDLAKDHKKIIFIKYFLGEVRSKNFAVRTLNYLINTHSASHNYADEFVSEINSLIDNSEMNNTILEVEGWINLSSFIKLMKLHPLSLLDNDFFQERVISSIRDVFYLVKHENYACLDSYDRSYNYLMRYIRLDELDLPQVVIDKLKLMNISNLLDFFLLPSKFISSSAMFTVVESNELFFLLDDFSFSEQKYAELQQLAFGRLFSSEEFKGYLLTQLPMDSNLRGHDLKWLAESARYIAGSPCERATDLSTCRLSHPATLLNLIKVGFILPKRITSIMNAI